MDKQSKEVNKTEKKELRQWKTPQFQKEEIENTAGGPKGPYPLTENTLYSSTS